MDCYRRCKKKDRAKRKVSIRKEREIDPLPAARKKTDFLAIDHFGQNRVYFTSDSSSFSFCSLVTVTLLRAG